MSKSKSPRVFNREFKLGIIRRLLAGENVSALGRELKLSRKDLYAWRDRFLAGGPQALRGRGRPPRAASGAAAPAMMRAPPDGSGEALAAAQRRVAELERKIGQQALEIDFLKGCLQRIEEQRMLQALTGNPRSTGRSKKK